MRARTVDHMHIRHTDAPTDRHAYGKVTHSYILHITHDMTVLREDRQREREREGDRQKEINTVLFIRCCLPNTPSLINFIIHQQSELFEYSAN